MRLARAWWTLVGLSFERLVWSTSTLLVALPLLACLLYVVRRDFTGMEDSTAAFVEFSDFVVFYATFFVPICALAYATTSIGGDREDRTLLFLLTRPLPRWLILSGKVAAAAPLVLGISVGALGLLCWLGGAAGATAWRLYLPSVLLSALAYLGLFQLFAVAFRYATVISMTYALFMELVLGNLPGIVKQLAISYYGRSMIFAAGSVEGFAPQDARWFDPVATPIAGWTLLAVAAVGLLLAALVFQWREYRDLS